MREPFVWQVRVYWENTDAGGVVYHSQYLNFFERARSEWLRTLGVRQAELAEREGLLFAIRHMEIDWLGPARLDDLLDVTVEDVDATGARLVFRQELRRSADRVLLARAGVTAVCLTADGFKPRKMPGWIRSELEHVE